MWLGGLNRPKWIDDALEEIENDTDNPVDPTYCVHEFDERIFFNMPYWGCNKCTQEMEFDEIGRHHTIASRCSLHKLPWEK